MLKISMRISRLMKDDIAFLDWVRKIHTASGDIPEEVNKLIKDLKESFLENDHLSIEERIEIYRKLRAEAYAPAVASFREDAKRPINS